MKQRSKIARLFAAALALVSLFACVSPSLAAALSPEEEVSLRTELQSYSTETKRILAYWENNSDVEIQYGYIWQLQYKEGSGWKTLLPDDKNTAFSAVGIMFPPGGRARQIYQLGLYSGSLVPGTYRIAADFSVEHGPKDSDSYPIYAEFEVVDAEGYVDEGELNDLGLGEAYRDITQDGFFGDTAARIYKHRKTNRSVLVYEGKIYQLGSYKGGLGVIRSQYIEDGENEYILYAYSYGAEKRRSQLAAFDLNAKKVVYRSPAFEGKDVSFSPREMLPGYGLRFEVHEGEYAVDDAMITRASYVEKVGTLSYKDGRFQYAPER